MSGTKSEVYAENDRLLKEYREGDEAALEKLVEINMGLVTGIAHRFRGRGVEYEDLQQIGCIGMIKAARSFDPDRGCVFSTYAVPLIMGEIRKYLRDDGIIKVSRTQKKLGAALLRERERYLTDKGREPTIGELADACGTTPEEAAVALESTSPVHSLSEVISGEDMTLESIIPSQEDNLSRTVEYVALAETMRNLPPLWRQIITLRYYKDYSQQQTADVLGMTQVKISREEKKIFERMKRELS